MTIWRTAGLILRDPRGSTRPGGGSARALPSSSIIAIVPGQYALPFDDERKRLGLWTQLPVLRSVAPFFVTQASSSASGPRRCVWPKRTHFASIRRRSTTSLIASTPARVIALGERSARTGPSPRRFATPTAPGSATEPEEPAAHLRRAAPAAGQGIPDPLRRRAARVVRARARLGERVEERVDGRGRSARTPPARPRTPRPAERADRRPSGPGRAFARPAPARAARRWGS